MTNDKILDYGEFFEGYNLCWIPAIQSQARGRPSGGMLIASKIHLNSIHLEKVGDMHTVLIKNKYFSARLFPVYLCKL